MESEGTRRKRVLNITHIPHHIPIHPHELSKFAIALVDLTGSAPQTCRNAHRREYTVVIEQHPLESFFDEHQILLRS